MVEAFLIQLADAVKDQLAGGSFAMPIAVSRAYRPRRTLRQLGDVVVTVAPASLEIAGETRGADVYKFAVDVAVQQKLVDDETKAESQADALMGLVQEIIDWALPLRLTSPAARCLDVLNEPAFSVEHWDEKRTFTSVIRLTFRAVR